MPTVAYGDTVECCGRPVAATVEAVQSVMTAAGLDAAGQAREWLRLAHRRPVPSWMEECTSQAERMRDLVQRERAVLAAVGGGVDLELAGSVRQRPAEPCATSHFEWLGERYGVPLEVLRDAIAALARLGFIAPDADQQAALRRALGVAVNSAERTSRAPWVRWMGGADALHYMVGSLWDMGLLFCAGGQRDKWKTFCGAFVDADGRCFNKENIRSYRCRNAAKRRVIDEAILNPLRFVGRGGAGGK